jgi:phospho-N-acetylmuramoyl-pentapeptide-transferase
MYLDLVKIFLPTTFAFFLGLFFTPFVTHFLYKYKMWKKYSRSAEINAIDFKKIHNKKGELNTPRIGGIIIWISALFVIGLFYFISIFYPTPITEKLNFLSRNQTLIPLFTLFIGSLIGLWDDLIQVYTSGRFARDDKSWRKWKALLIACMSLLIGLWFFYKLGITTLHIPFGGEMYFGILIIPFFIIVALATFSGGVIDGIDGLAGGVFASIFGAYSAIAFANHQIDLAAFSGVITGAILAFLWFNIPPARFYMGETGMLGLCCALTVVAFLTDSILVLPIIGFLLVIESGSVIIQLLSKKFRKKKVFLAAPIHHHFEAKGWPHSKITMRFWVIGVVVAIIGLAIRLLG